MMSRGHFFLDATSACKSAVNTGVQRTTRGLFAALEQRLGPEAVTPLAWDNWRGCAYHTLSRGERRFLCEPFHAGGGGATPEKQAARLWTKLTRGLVHRWNRFDWRSAQPGDVLLQPDIFQDRRTAFDLRQARSVAVFHDAIGWTHPELTPACNRPDFPGYMTALHRAWRVVCVSRQSAEDLVTFWRQAALPPKAVDVLPWPLPLEGTRPGLSFEDAAPGLRRVLCVATLEPRKNHLKLLAACEGLWSRGARFELILVGKQDPEGSQSVRTALEALRLKGRPLQWLGHLDDVALAREYRHASFTVFPSIMEGFGLPILESLWFGRPCVCGGNGALGEVAAGGGCLAVDQNDVEALAGSIRSLLEDKTLHERLCEEARARVFRRWADYVEELLAFMQKPAVAAHTPKSLHAVI